MQWTDKQMQFCSGDSAKMICFSSTDLRRWAEYLNNMKNNNIQFIYHPENDDFIANKIINESGLGQKINIQNLSIKELNAPGVEYWEGIKGVDVIILLIGSTFDRIAPYIYLHDDIFKQKKSIFGIDISSLPNEWGERREKFKVWLGWHSRIINKSMDEVIKIHSIPKVVDGYVYVSAQIPEWVKVAKKFSGNGYA